MTSTSNHVRRLGQGGTRLGGDGLVPCHPPLPPPPPPLVPPPHLRPPLPLGALVLLRGGHQAEAFVVRKEEVTPRQQEHGEGRVQEEGAVEIQSHDLAGGWVVDSTLLRNLWRKN